MSHRSHMLLISAGLLSLSAAAFAQPPAPPSGIPGAGGPAIVPPANRADLKTRLEQRFDMVDANHDGTLTVEERRAKRAQVRDQMRDRVFARLDADHDGSLSKSEVEAPPPHRGPAGAGMHRGPGPHARMPGAMMLRRQLAAYRDKPITKTTFVDAGLGLFDRVDTDHDGTISPAERDAARKAMRDRFAPANRPPPPPPGL